uniref:RRM domain-containing protein n=2 Tax=Catharus TaxID=9184 RepID=A0A8C3UFM6_CATUS
MLEGPRRLSAASSSQRWGGTRDSASGTKRNSRRRERAAATPPQPRTETPRRGRDALRAARRGARAEAAQHYLAPRRGEVHHTPQVGRVALPIEAKKPAERILPALTGQGRRHFGPVGAGPPLPLSVPPSHRSPDMAAASAVRAAGRRSRQLFDIFVAEVPWTVSSKELKEYFSQFGSVQRCQLPFDRNTGFHRRYCWIKFSTPEEVQNVLQKDPHILEGSKLTLKQQIHRRRSQRKNQSE